MTPKVTTGYTKELCTKISNSLKLFSCAFFFKTLLKENYVIALDSCYMFTQKTWNMELNMMLIVHSIVIPDLQLFELIPWNLSR